MKYILSIHAYDVISYVNYTASIREYADYEDGPSQLVLRQGGAFLGEGVDDAAEWLRDVLVHLLESL